MPQRQPTPSSNPPGDASRPPPSPDVRRAKLLPPRPPADAVPRPALEARLERAAGGPLTLVAAGAGFGKTTLVSAWASRTRRPVAWLSLDAEDADPRRFLRHLLAALRTAAPGIAPAMDDLLGGSREPDPATAAAVLGDELLDLPGETVLVLDDLHAVAGAPPVAMLSELLRYPPPDLRIVAVSRFALPELGLETPGSLPVAAIHERDLRLDEPEIAALLGPDSALAPGDVAARTDGWAAGVRAMAVAGVAAGPQRMRDYLRRDVLTGQPPELVDFLRDVAILERVSPPLAAAVSRQALADERAGALLAHAERHGLFVSRLDEDGHWWRIHPLLRDVLRQDAAAPGGAADPGHARAAAWFAAAGMVDEAVGHALRSGDADAAADLVAGFVPAWLAHGGDLPLHWIERLDAAAIARRPALLIVQGHHLVTVGNAPAALAALDEAERLLAAPGGSGVPAPEAASLAAEIASARGQAANVAGDPRALLAELDAGIAAGLRGNARQYTGVVATWGLAMAMAGRSEESLARLEAAAQAESRAGGAPPVRLLVNVAGLMLRQARFAEARRWMGLLDAAIVEPSGGFATVWSALLRALVAWFEGDLAEVDAVARVGLAAAPGRFFVPKRQIAEVLARALLAQGRVDEARIVAAEDRRRIELAGAAGLLPGLEALEAEIALAAGDRRTARRWADSAAVAFPPDVLRATDHPAMAQARIWLDRDAPGDAARAAAALQRLADHQAAVHSRLSQLRTLPLLAVAQDAAGDRAAALATLREALADAPASLPIRFADAGPRAPELLAALAADPADVVAASAAAALGSLQAEREAPAAPPAAWPWPGPSPLTARQAQILAMVAAGKTNKEIGEALGITAISARDHVRRILRKLGVHRRHEAVSVARAAGWM